MSDSTAPPPHQLQQLAQAEAILDRTLGYQAAQAVHELKTELGLDVAEIRLSAHAMPDAPGTFRVTCTIISLTDTVPIKLELVVKAPYAAPTLLSE